MKNSKILHLLLIILFTLGNRIGPLYAQSVTKENTSFKFKNKLVIESEIDINTESLIEMENPYVNDPDINISYQIALVYTKDNKSDIENSYWRYKITGEILDINSVPIDYPIALEISNTQEEGVYEMTSAYISPVSLPTTASGIILKMLSYDEQETTPPEDIRLEVRLIFDKNITSVITPELFYILETSNNDTKELIRWTDIPGADHYELQYMYYDYKHQTGANNINWYQEGLTVETHNNFYNFDLAYPNTGRIYFRVRAVGYDVNNRLIFSDWSIVGDPHKTVFSLDEFKNWKFTTNFAEEGKYKKVINYYDKSLRNRQTQTYLNSENLTLVAETDYDLEGRPTIQILPVPSVTNDLKFKTNFNISDEISYNYKHHEKTMADALDITSGAGKYYSGNNDIDGINMNYIPDASVYPPDEIGYPMTQMKYKRDHTGRIASQGGLGPEYQLSSGKESKYYYLTPTNHELQYMFGNEVGDKDYYKKNIVVDPNGQSSVSYLDMTGKTIATALIGGSPNNVQSLNPAQSSSTEVLKVEDTYDPLISESINIFYHEIDESIDYNFEYNFEGLIYQEPNVTLCLSCTYYLTLDITDEEGTTVFNEIQEFTPSNCTNEDFTLLFQVTIDKIGPYTIHKKLSTASFTIEELEDVLTTNLTDGEIRAEVYSTLSIEECAYTCEFFISWAVNQMYSGYYIEDFNIDDNEDLVQFNEFMEDCEINITDPNEGGGFDNCEAMKFLMIHQINEDYVVYANDDQEPASVINVSNPLYIFDKDGVEYSLIEIGNDVWVLTEISTGSIVIDNKITIEVINGGVTNYENVELISIGAVNSLILDPTKKQEQFADALVSLHREYCHYDACVILKPSKLYDVTISQHKTIEDFTGDPDSTIDDILASLKDNDPFYIGNSFFNCVLSDLFDEKIENYKFRTEDDIGLCNELLAANYIDCNFKTIYEFTADLEAWDGEQKWSFISTNYKSFKQEIIEDCTALCDGETVDENSLFKNTFLDDNLTLQDVLQLIEDNQNSECQGRVISWLNKFLEIYPYYSEEDNDDEWLLLKNELIPHLEQHCTEICTPIGKGTVWKPTNNPSQFNECDYGVVYNISYFGMPADPINQFLSNEFELQNSSVYTDFNADLVSNGLTEYSSSEIEKEFVFTYVESGVPSIDERLIVFTKFLSYDQIKNLKIEIFIPDIAEDPNVWCFGGVNSNWEKVNFTHTTNLFGDIIIDYNCLGVKQYYIRFIQLNNEGQPNAKLAFELYSDYDYRETYSSSYNLPEHIYPYLNGLYEVATKLGSTTSPSGSNFTTDEVFDFTTKIWNCETYCSDVNICFDEIMTTIIDNFPDDIDPNANQYDVYYMSENSSSSCFTDISLHVDPVSNSSWIEIEGSDLYGVGQTYIIKFFTEDGLAIPISDHMKILSYTATTIPYNWIDKYIFDNGFVESKIMTLWSSSNIDFPDNELSHRYVRAFALIEEKPGYELTDLVTSCDVPFDETAYLEDCYTIKLEIAEEIIEAEFDKIKKDLINNFSFSCRENINEEFKITYPEGAKTEYQYTLYYYDQAGNVIQTVPPEGFVPQTGSDYHTKISNYTYNSFNQIEQQITPDAGITTMYYDDVQRLRMSQNAEQNDHDEYAYTKYDKQSRVIEVGEVTNLSSTPTIDQLNDPNFPTDYLEDRTITEYSVDHDINDNIDQVNLRGRVSYTEREGHGSTYYSYDAHGNVNLLRQDIIDDTGDNDITYDYDIAYEYDLISGNVIQVNYNDGSPDQYHHRYEYDDDNRLKSVYTSAENVLWEEEARYFYYPHGPLARVELGHDKIQGMDYIYTLQGWIKSNNLPGTDSHVFEPGKDGNVDITNINQFMGRDAMSYTLAYNQMDYTPIGTNTPMGSTVSTLWSDPNGPKTEILSEEGLFNGNIVSMITDIKNPDSDLNTYAYQYDQLHRIKQAKPFNFDGTNWTATNNFETDYEYDKDGNITHLNRYDNIGYQIDDLSYQYPLGTDQPNKLESVIEASSTDEGYIPQGNYVYDKIGNLIAVGMDTNIEWDVYGKVKQVSGDGRPTINYKYGPDGNRIAKITDGTPYFYVRDASGNVMATYKEELDENDETIIVQKEVSIYGSSRLGIHKTERPTNLFELEAYRTRNHKYYELSNHLGNVLATITDRKWGVTSTGDPAIASYYTPSIITTADYYPFGMEMASRTISSSDYRYGFNGKEKDENGEFGSLTHYDYGFRIYNPAIGKFLSVDPLTQSYPMLTPYQFASNTPIAADDLDGLESRIRIYTINEGKVVTTTYDAETLKKTVHAAGTYALHSNISKEEWINVKTAYWNGYSELANSFTSGHGNYTLGEAGKNRNGFTGVNYGTLTIAAAPNGTTLAFDPTHVKSSNPLSLDNFSNARKLGAKGMNRLFINPKSSREKAFNKAVNNYMFMVSGPISATAFGTSTLVGVSARAGILNGLDDLSANITSGGESFLNTIGTGGKTFKTGLGLAGMLGAGFDPANRANNAKTGLSILENIVNGGIDTYSTGTSLNSTIDSITE